MNELIYLGIIVLAMIFIYIGYKLGNKVGGLKTNKQWELNLPKIRSESIKRSRQVIGGQFSEQLAPYLPDFPYKPTECKFMGKPIDLIVFNGMDEKNINEIIFVEIKSGDSKLSTTERKLRDCIKEKRIRWQEYRISKKLTK